MPIFCKPRRSDKRRMLKALRFLDNSFKPNLSYPTASEASGWRWWFETHLQLVEIVNDRVGSSELL